MKIVITGPESTGKTTLVEALSSYFNIDHVPEVARDYLLRQVIKYDYADLLIIAKEQQKAIEENAKENKLVISDTDLLTIKIWSEYKYHKCDDWIINKLKEKRADLYLLCYPDIPWEADLLRENPNDRKDLFEIYQNEIVTLRVPFVKIFGGKDQRLSLAIRVIEERINQF